MIQQLKSYGIDDSSIKKCAGTGLVVDIWGTATDPSPTELVSQTTSLVALRCDLDGLHMPENNPDLSYKTTTDHAHMCGHDGHMVMILNLGIRNWPKYFP
jgi:metal-dependent amidase/aminoacylase/carboxypeptidase family protein